MGYVARMSNDDEGMRHSVSFTLEPGQVREISDEVVEAFDSALAAAGTGDVHHFIDPRRLQTFEAGGPSVWSVATVPTEAGTLYLTYGFSEAIDPARVGVDFELSIVVPGEAVVWPALLLRTLCRYMLTSKRPLEVGQSMPFPAPLSRFFASPEEREDYPDTSLDAAFFVEDPLLPTIRTERRTVSVRRVFGLHDKERALLDLWTPQGFEALARTRDAAFATVLDRAPWTEDAEFVAAIEAGSQRDGSQVSFVAVPGVQWEQEESGALVIGFPGGAYAQQIRRMVRARLPFGRHLLVHDLDPDKTDAVAFEPAKALGFHNEGSTLVVSIPADHELFDTLEQVDGPGVNWRFGSE